jgi:hypothetical protein
VKNEIIESDKDLNGYFKILDKISDEDQIHDNRCKFCKSENRKEAEELWEKCRRFTSVVEFFQKKGENMNVNNVRTHIKGHYLKQEQMIMRRHYANHLLSFINSKIEKVNLIELYLSILQDKAWKYASSESESEDKTIKNCDMLIKIIKQSAELIKLQAELSGGLKNVQIVVDKFQQIFVSAINKIDDPELKMYMVKELENLKETTVIDV